MKELKLSVSKSLNRATDLRTKVRISSTADPVNFTLQMQKCRAKLQIKSEQMKLRKSEIMRPLIVDQKKLLR